MTQQEIKDLEKKLWDLADGLRANSQLTAAEYKDPLLGLVFLRYAQNYYEEAKAKLEKSLPVNLRTGKQREATKDDFKGVGAIMLPEVAQYDYLVNLPDGADIADYINEAMSTIESEYPSLEGVLPKNYQELDPNLIREMLRTFNEEDVKAASGDIFGKIYEYFLMKFSMIGAGAQEGGEFFTPPSIVNTIVSFIEPDHGILYDPACGSGGMFVQSAEFIKRHADQDVNERISVYGTEYKQNTARLAKMNLAIHGIEGQIFNANSFYNDPHQLVGKCDFVMANPPFNVDKVDNNDYVKEDPRLPFGAPLTGKGKIGNANYLWIQYFLSYLNEKGRSGFVMASSATDAGHAEKRIRRNLVETDQVECIISLGNNFFYTRSLPCHLWFFNKGKAEQCRNKILMIDARNVFRVVNSTTNDFSPGQQRNLSCMIRLFRGNDEAVADTLEAHRHAFAELASAIHKQYKLARISLEELLEHKDYNDVALDAPIQVPEINLETAETVADQFESAFPAVDKAITEREQTLDELIAETQGNSQSNAGKQQNKKEISALRAQVRALRAPLKTYREKTAEKRGDVSQNIKDWKALLEYFPEGQYRDVEGLCKIVDRSEVEEQDYSLTPGRYVGVAINIDPDFDYRGRIAEIQAELKDLNSEANTLMEQIQSVEV